MCLFLVTLQGLKMICELH